MRRSISSSAALVCVVALTVATSRGADDAAPAAAAVAPPAKAGGAAPGAKAPPPVRLSPTANGMGLRLQFAVKDLTPEQKQKSIPILQALDKEYGPLERAKEDEHQSEMRRALETRTPIDLKASALRRDQWSRRMYKLENRYEDRIGAEVLTPKQRAAWDAYRIHFAGAFQLSFTGIGTEGAKKLQPITEQVVKDIPGKPGDDGWALFQRRLAELKERAAKDIMNEEQRAKFADLKAKRAEHERAVDALEADPATATKLPPPPPPAGDPDGLD